MVIIISSSCLVYKVDSGRTKIRPFLKMGKQIHYYTKKGLSIESLKKVFGWSFCDVWVHIPEISQSFVHLVEEDGCQKWFFANGLLKHYRPGAKKPEYYSWKVVAGAIKLSEPDPAIELGGIY